MALRVEDVAAIATAASFTVPPHLEARSPAEIRGRGRDDVRLLVTRGPSGDATDARFGELRAFLNAGDLLVVNASATVPSSLSARTAGGSSTFRLHVSTRLPGGPCVVEARDHVPCRGEIALLAAGATVAFLAPYRDSRRLWTARLRDTGDLIEYLYRWGKPIVYPHVKEAWPIETYQNVFASEAGSAEMPSAGRPFTREHLQQLQDNGVRIASIVLHTGVSSPERDEPPYEELFHVPPESAELVAQTHATHNRVVAVGTSVVRALESATDERGRIHAADGWTDLVIRPERCLRVVDGMLTGFHEPRSTHLAMLEALAGTRHIVNAYDAALGGRYLWHEFGDSHLILPT